MATRRKGYKLHAEEGDNIASLGGNVDRLLAQEALDDADQELLIEGLETIHDTQKSRNADVLTIMTLVSALFFSSVALRRLFQKGIELRSLAAPLSTSIGHLPFLANQFRLNPRYRFRIVQKYLVRFQIDMRYMVLWHTIPLVAGILQREPWQSLLLWFVPPALAACTILAESDARDLDFTLAALKGQKYELKGA